MVWVKICGVTNEADALACLNAGVDAVGLNLVPASKRYVDPERAARLVAFIAGRVTTVAVVADRTAQDLVALQTRTRVDWLQLHGHESPEAVEALGVPAFKAVRIANDTDVDDALRFTGPRLLADAKSDAALGGTGTTFDWSLAERLARERQLILAGGLNPDNVAAAVTSLGPWGVDVASGVETADPRRKDARAILDFVRNARAARV